MSASVVALMAALVLGPGPGSGLPAAGRAMAAEANPASPSQAPASGPSDNESDEGDGDTRPEPAHAKGGRAESGRTDPGPQRTGLPLPRFASLVSNKVNIRRGPGKIYPVDWVFVRKGMPVEITAEWELWRKIRDQDGTAGWVHKSMLAGTRTALIAGEIRTIRRRPDQTADALARAEPGVIGKILSCQGEWCRLDLGQARGWLPKSEFFGAYPNEELD